MNGRFLLDTNIIIALFAQDASVLQNLSVAAEVSVPCVVLGELYYGAQKSTRVLENIARLDAVAAGATVLSCDAETARHYGQVKDALRAKGRPVPENDLWIAALAFQHALTLVSRDSHFEQIDGLPREAR
jgi:tRNA(fMet)-specific endonuclease VapC